MIPRKRIMFEEDLHEIFYKFPYLITNESNSIINTIHEYKLNSDSIPDIYIEEINKKTYCEIKITKLNEKDLYQAMRYLNALNINRNEIQNEGLSVVLIGMKVSNQLKKKASEKGIEIKIIGESIPEVIKICKYCRKAYDFKYLTCNFCNSDELFEIVTLKYP